PVASGSSATARTPPTSRPRSPSWSACAARAISAPAPPPRSPSSRSWRRPRRAEPAVRPRRRGLPGSRAAPPGGGFRGRCGRSAGSPVRTPRRRGGSRSSSRPVPRPCATPGWLRTPRRHRARDSRAPEARLAGGPRTAAEPALLGAAGCRLRREAPTAGGVRVLEAQAGVTRVTSHEWRRGRLVGMTPTPHIVVLGAGYTGLTAAKLLARRAPVTLVNDRDRFVERMRNHQLAAGQPVRGTPLRDLVAGTGVRLVVDRVTRIDPDRREVELASGAEPIGYDLLVYALGSTADLDAVPGAAEHAVAVADAERAVQLQDRMRAASTVAVVGGGLTGIEVATELAESHPDRTVRLVSAGRLGPALSERGQEHLYRTFDRFGIRLHEHAPVAKVGPDG